MSVIIISKKYIKMSNLTSPYYETLLNTRVTIKADQITHEISNHMLSNLKNKVENKCNKEGFIVRVHQIVSHNNGIIDADTFMGSVNYNVSYSCYFCSPKTNTDILCKVQKCIDGFITAVNGPISIGVSLARGGKEITYLNHKVMFNGQEISLGDIIKVTILTSRISEGETKINSLAKLKSIANKTEKEMYEKEINMFINNDNRDDMFI